MSIPQGYAAHPSAPGWMYQLANPNNVVQVPNVAPGPSPYHDQPLGGYQQPTYGQADSSLVDEEIAGLKTFGKGDTTYIKFPKVANVGDTAAMTLRFMPPWRACEKFPYLKVNRHRLPQGIIPESKK